MLPFVDGQSEQTFGVSKLRIKVLTRLQEQTEHLIPTIGYVFPNKVGSASVHFVFTRIRIVIPLKPALSARLAAIALH